jgi:photosystem II stability/assembly factor-like uncharacterized protein
MKGPRDAQIDMTTARQGASERAKRRFPGGKALGRIQYFETQRGLPKAGLVKGRVAAPTAARPRVAKKRAVQKPQASSSHYEKANKVKTALIPKFAGSTQLPVWRSLGPNFIPNGQTYGKGGNNQTPVSGRCVGLMISPTNPQHLVLCSGGGGLWGTMNQGKTWQPLTDQQPTLSMGAIAAAPGSPNIVYAGTGEGDNLSLLGVGLLRSSDGGQTWKLVRSKPLSGIGVYDIVVDPTDPLHVWVGTTEELLETTNGGAKWRVVQPATTWDISINSTSPQEIFAATAAGLVRSANGGTTWTKVQLPGTKPDTKFERLEVCHAPSKPSIVYVAGCFDGKIALWRRTTIGGAFKAQTPPAMKPNEDIRQAWYDWCVAVSPANPDIVYWGAVHLYKGTRSSSGWKWQNISTRDEGDSIHADQHHIAFDPSDPNVLYVCNDGGLFRSPNAGKNWKALNPGLGMTEFEFLIHLESQDAWLIGGTQDNGTLGSTHSSRWSQIALGDGGDCAVNEDQNLCYHSYFWMWIERAAAAGPKAFKWIDCSPPCSDDYEALFYPPMDVKGKVVAKAGVTLWVSDDNGENWEEIDFGGGGEKVSAVVIFDKKTLFVGTEAGQIVRVRRGRNNWSGGTITLVTSPVGGFISDIVVPADPTKVIWASCSAFGVGHVFRSTNGGKTWADRTGNLPDIPVNAIVFDPKTPDRIFAATDHGVYQSQNAGTKWTDFSNGLPNAIVGDMILHERLRLLRVGTRNRGAWEVKI